MENKTLSSVVKSAREKLGISQRELSRRTGIDNNTLAKIEKGERKKPNVLSLRKLSVVLKIEFENLLKLSDYSEEDIVAITSDSYNNIAIIPENAPVLLLDDLLKQFKEELYIKQIIKELLKDVDISKFDIESELKQTEKKKSIKKYIEENNGEIEKIVDGINHLNSLLNKES
ncbi:MAG: helix-turn-helix transcriptional regulator [Bacilli bacterium]|nr:helix-turn-helix transcriptional regulator [Bacilli bacterium]